MKPLKHVKEKWKTYSVITFLLFCVGLIIENFIGDGMMINILKQLLDLIEKIPAAFWGVVIGSFFTLFGIVIANRANDRRSQAQIEHDREMRNRDRELALRKDVYLSAAEAISAGVKAIGRFADLEIPDNKLMEDYTNKSSSIAKGNYDKRRGRNSF